MGFQVSPAVERLTSKWLQSSCSRSSPFRELARLTDPELGRAVRFPKVENAMLRSRLPKRINLTPRGRDRLFELGESLGAVVRELISYVSAPCR